MAEMVFDNGDDFDQFIANAREEAVLWAKGLLARKDWVILDTETTGLMSNDQVVQVGILAPDGAVLLDTLVQATCEMSSKAFMVHGISAKMLASAQGFAEVLPKIREIAGNKYLVIFNGEYDTRMLVQSARAAGLPAEDAYFMWIDAMMPYAKFVGEWNDYYGNFRWQRLPGGDHSAIGDCKATLELIKRMAGEEDAISSQLSAIS